MNALLLLMVVLAAVLAWGGLRPRRRPTSPHMAGTLVAPEPVAVPAPEPAADHAGDVQFRAGPVVEPEGPVLGDVLCSDGVYVPHVWEADFHTSFDGRWIRCGGDDTHPHRLVDRKQRRSWELTRAEATWVESLHSRLPRWNDSAAASNGVAHDSVGVLTEVEFDALMAQRCNQRPQPLAAVCDLWVPVDCLPTQAPVSAPAVPQPEGAAVQLGVQRHWPDTLRDLPDPLEPLRHPRWQLMLNDQPHAWIVEDPSGVVWRSDGQAFACLGYPPSVTDRSAALRLGMWSVEHGGQQWSESMPADHKDWQVQTVQADSQVPAARRVPPLRWEGDVVLQRMQADVVVLDRLRDGTQLQAVTEVVEGVAGHASDGRIGLGPLPRMQFDWRRDPAKPAQWQAQSMPMAGHPLVWTLTQEADGTPGSTAGYQLQWNGHSVPGLWELEHVIVQGRWAALRPWSKPSEAGQRSAVWVWDGKQLHPIEIPWRLQRLRAVPDVRGAQGARVELVVHSGGLPPQGGDPSAASWRWPVRPLGDPQLSAPDCKRFYEVRSIAQDAHGQWRLRPRWREVQKIQHPCADGDYVWRPRGDIQALWWFGGHHAEMNNTWVPDRPRVDGVTVVQGGAALCGTGPSACPHPAGDGWLVLELIAHGNDAPHYWKLHWLRPAKRMVQSMELRAYLPILQGWDGGLDVQWYDAQVPQNTAAGTPATPSFQVIAALRWNEVHSEELLESTQGLWLRRQDLRYAQTIAARDDWPWKR